MSKTVEYPPILTFPKVYEPREQALKVLEEASELVEAVKRCDKFQAQWEFCDLLQAMGNLANSMDWENRVIDHVYEWVYKSNVTRGRYNE